MMAMSWNRALGEACVEQGYGWIDVSSRLIDHATGLVDRRFCKDDDTEIHLEEQALAPLYAGA